MVSTKHTPGPLRYVVVLLDEARTKRGTNFFQFWDRDIYGDPQFCDEAHAKRYTSLSGCLSRVRALRNIGLNVGYTTTRAAIAKATGSAS